MIDQKRTCDDQKLLQMLQADSDRHDSAKMLEHVESCEHCQHRLDELAADPSQWNRTVEVLSAVARDDDVEELENFRPSLDMPRITRHVAWTDAMAKSLLSAASHPEMLGRVGRYDVERLIGSGGMGVVFKAHDTELNRPVAVKLLAPYLASSGAARSRFAREACAAAAVVDDHVVPIHNVETEGEHPFLVMKYIAGGSLQQRLDRDGPLEVCEVLRIGMQTAKGLAAAHAQGLIHRDVKPSNILLDEGVDRALLTDFGLARATDDASLTRSGFHPGTPHFMSPEQVRGEAIDARSDLFGLGCVLYALCTGHPPFRSETSYAVLRRITDDTPRPIRETNPDVPQWLERIVMKLLAKSPDARFDSASEVADLLERCIAHVQHPLTTSLPECVAATLPDRGSRPPWSKLVAVAAFGFSIILAGVLIVLETNKGTLTIESEVDDVPIRIMQGDKVVERLTVQHSRDSVRMAAGNYVVVVEGPTDAITVTNGQVSLRRGAKEIVKVTRAPDQPTASSSLPHREIQFVLGESNFRDKDKIEIHSVTSTGNGFEIGATVTVAGRYTLQSAETAHLGFYSTITLNHGEKPTPTPTRPSQMLQATRGTNEFNLSMVISRMGNLHVSFYDSKTGEGMGGVYFAPKDSDAESVADTYSDVEVQFYGTGGSATERLSHAINKAIVGEEAPEIAAADINGKPFRLSNLRGKIVVLVFAQSVGDDYAEMYAPLRQLVAKYKQAPVRFVGIMSNDDQANLQAASKRGDLPWTVIPESLNGPLQLDWSIKDYLNVYIVDAEGILHPPLHMPHWGDGGYDTKVIDDELEVLLRTEKVSDTRHPLSTRPSAPEEESSGSNSTTANLTLVDAINQFNWSSQNARQGLFNPPIPNLTINQFRDAMLSGAYGYKNESPVYHQSASDAELSQILSQFAETGELPFGLRGDLTSPVDTYERDTDGQITLLRTLPRLTLFRDNNTKSNVLNSGATIDFDSLELIFQKDGSSSKRYGDPDLSEAAKQIASPNEKPAASATSGPEFDEAKRIADQFVAALVLGRDADRKAHLAAAHQSSLDDEHKQRSLAQEITGANPNFAEMYLNPRDPSDIVMLSRPMNNAWAERVMVGFTKEQGKWKIYSFDTYDEQRVQQFLKAFTRGQFPTINIRPTVLTPTLESAAEQFNRQTADARERYFNPPITDLTVQQLKSGTLASADSYKANGNAELAKLLTEFAETGVMPSGVRAKMIRGGSKYTLDRFGALNLRQFVPTLVIESNDSSEPTYIQIESLELISHEKDGPSSKVYGDPNLRSYSEQALDWEKQKDVE